MPTKIICLANQKGGVGKTTTAVSLAHGLAINGRRVLLIDLDPQGQCAAALGLDPEPGAFHLLTMGDTPREIAMVRSGVRFSGRDRLNFLPGNHLTTAAQTILNLQNQPISTIRRMIQNLFRDDQQIIILDTAPGAGGIQQRAIWASDLVIVPTASDFPSTDGLARDLRLMSLLQKRRNWHGNLLGILPTFHNEQNPESKTSMEYLRERHAPSLLPAIHASPLLRECTAGGLTIFEFDALCRAAKEYLALVRHVMKFLEAVG